MQISNEYLEQKIYQVRGQKVMVDSDLAELYGVATKVLNQAVRRNVERFPASFMFQLSPGEEEFLRSQIVTSKPKSEIILPLLEAPASPKRKIGFKPASDKIRGKQ
ncbi:MAG: ORF6N domain-containing protein [Erysipelotrichia bacterium]|nr:ORF6N domain-containing protein [Erysipelotrichia bacterium]